MRVQCAVLAVICSLVWLNACGGSSETTSDAGTGLPDQGLSADTGTSADLSENTDASDPPPEDVTISTDENTLPSDPGSAPVDQGTTQNDPGPTPADSVPPAEDEGSFVGIDTNVTLPPTDPAAQAQCQDFALCDAGCQGNPTCVTQCGTDFPTGKTMLEALSQCLINVCGNPNSFAFGNCAKQAKWDECLSEYAACYQGDVGCLTIRDCTLACTDWQCQNLCIWSGTLTSQFIFTSLMECIGNNCNQACGSGDPTMCDTCVTQYCGVLRDECINDANN